MAFFIIKSTNSPLFFPVTPMKKALKMVNCTRFI